MKAGRFAFSNSALMNHNKCAKKVALIDTSLSFAEWKIILLLIDLYA